MRRPSLPRASPCQTRRTASIGQETPCRPITSPRVTMGLQVGARSRARRVPSGMSHSAFASPIFRSGLGTVAGKKSLDGSVRSEGALELLRPTRACRSSRSEAVVCPTTPHRGSCRSVRPTVFGCLSGRFQVAPVSEGRMAPVNHRPSAGALWSRQAAIRATAVAPNLLEHRFTALGGRRCSGNCHLMARS